MLADLLAPVSVDDFLSTYWLKRHLFCRGAAHRFSPLLSWTTLNDILEHHWRETYRFRLALQGRDVDPASYADLDGFTPRVRSKDVTDHLRRGATLSFDAIDEVHEPLTRLAQAFEAFFRGGTKINIYAGWRAQHGLDLHRDNQEIFILQLDGRKHWLLYGFSIDGIDRSALATTSVPPAGAQLDEILQPGDLLYIPRGCYHVALPMNEPTLHLTLGVKNPQGIDLLRWMVERLSGTPIAAQDVPILVSRAERLRYADALRAALRDGLDADVVEQYLAEKGSNFKPRPSFSLPWSATPELLPAGQAFQVRMHAHTQISVTASGSSACELQCAGRRFRFPHGMHCVIEQLKHGSDVPMEALAGALAGQLDGGALRMLLGMLIKENLVSIRPL